MRLFRTLLLGGSLLVIAVAALADEAPRRLFFAFDNGVGRGEWTPERQAATLAELGYDGISYSGLKDLDERLAACDRRGLRVFNLYVGATLGPGGPTFDPRLPEAIRRLRGRDTALWLFIRGTADDAESQAVAVVRTIADLAAASGLRVVLYPHFRFHVERVEDAVRIVRAAGRANVGVTFNLCHFLRVDEERHLRARLVEALPLVEFVSLNGADAGDTRAMGWDRLIQPLDRGTFDVAGLLALLDELGYRGPVGLQCYQVPGDPVENLRRSMTAWRELEVIRRSVGSAQVVGSD